MYVTACRIYREGGAPIQSHNLGFIRPTDVGWLVCKDALDKRTGRWIKRAWLLNDDRTKNVYPPLSYVDITLDNGAIHIRGEEQDQLSGKLTAMGWYCEIIDGRRHGQDSRGPLPA
jgi:hypothetical protein